MDSKDLAVTEIPRPKYDSRLHGVCELLIHHPQADVYVLKVEKTGEEVRVPGPRFHQEYWPIKPNAA